MSYIYVDESIHDRASFIVVAAVCADEDLGAEMACALTEAGFTPGVDEFKSSMRMAGNAAAQQLRSHLRYLLMRRCKVAVAICSVDERQRLVEFTYDLVDQLMADDLVQSGTLFLDEGIKKPGRAAPYGWRVEANCDSRQVPGIQMADCAAHTVATMVLAELGLVTKMVATDGLYPEPEVEMAWSLWTSLRYALSSGTPVGGFDDEGLCEPMMKPFGLLVSEALSEDVKAAVDERLGAVWVGCIH